MPEGIYYRLIGHNNGYPFQARQTTQDRDVVVPTGIAVELKVAEFGAAIPKSLQNFGPEGRVSGPHAGFQVDAVGYGEVHFALKCIEFSRLRHPPWELTQL